jgi:hypothetical protein
MPIVPIPPAATVSVRVDGSPIRAYARAIIVGGHTYAPIDPYLTTISRCAGYDSGELVIERDDRSVRIRMPAISPNALDRAYVEIAPLLRGLGESVSYDSGTRTVDVTTPHAFVVVTPQPPNPFATPLAPRAVFTPTPLPTPTPIWTGPPEPRRTPLPYPVPT